MCICLPVPRRFCKNRVTGFSILSCNFHKLRARISLETVACVTLNPASFQSGSKFLLCINIIFLNQFYDLFSLALFTAYLHHIVTVIPSSAVIPLQSLNDLISEFSHWLKLFESRSCLPSRSEFLYLRQRSKPLFLNLPAAFSQLLL